MLTLREILPYRTPTSSRLCEVFVCPVAPIRVAVMCHHLYHITASFDERKGILYTASSVCIGHVLIFKDEQNCIV
jgi:hypothetical protein